MVKRQYIYSSIEGSDVVLVLVRNNADLKKLSSIVWTDNTCRVSSKVSSQRHTAFFTFRSGISEFPTNKNRIRFLVDHLLRLEVLRFLDNEEQKVNAAILLVSSVLLCIRRTAIRIYTDGLTPESSRGNNFVRRMNILWRYHYQEYTASKVNITITIPDISHRPFFYLKDDVSETILSPCSGRTY
jgi:hypothetical protein